MNFKEPYEILQFVLWKCGGMAYNDATDDNHDDPEHHYEINITSKIIDTQRIYYADKLLVENFNIHITSLVITGTIQEEDFEWLCKMSQLEYLELENCDNLSHVPELPETLQTLSINSDRLKEIIWNDERFLYRGGMYDFEILK